MHDGKLAVQKDSPRSSMEEYGTGKFPIGKPCPGKPCKGHDLLLGELPGDIVYKPRKIAKLRIEGEIPAEPLRTPRGTERVRETLHAQIILQKGEYDRIHDSPAAVEVVLVNI